MSLPATDDFDGYSASQNLGDQTNWTAVQNNLYTIDLLGLLGSGCANSM